MHGDFTWYELMTPDPDAAERFYGPMLGWRFEPFDNPGMEYRFFSTGEGAVGGFMKTPGDAGMPPAWVGYVAVDDVDATAKSIGDGGGAVHKAPWDVSGVGRMAVVADPQGAVFMVMKAADGVPEGVSFSYDKPRPGHCAWNELATSDPEAALHFYGQRFGWVKDGEMEMGPLGTYHFLRHAGRAPDGSAPGQGVIGAVYPKVAEDQNSHWLFYFRVADVDAVVAHIENNGGKLHQPPTEIPGGDSSLVGVDPQGAFFGVVGGRTAS